MQAMVELLNTGVDFALNEVVTYRNLKNEWNNMSIRPKFKYKCPKDKVALIEDALRYFNILAGSQA